MWRALRGNKFVYAWRRCGEAMRDAQWRIVASRSRGAAEWVRSVKQVLMRLWWCGNAVGDGEWLDVYSTFRERSANSELAIVQWVGAW